MDDSTSVIELLLFAVFTIGPLIVCYLTGRYFENQHYKSINERERKFAKKPVVTLGKTILANRRVVDSRFVTGSVVIGQDHFRRFIAALRNIVGGRVTSYESLLDRAKREAILRCQESAPNFDTILNLRFETMTIGYNCNQGGAKNAGAVEVLAYGTAIKFETVK